jgi:hypothetical protein
MAKAPKIIRPGDPEYQALVGHVTDEDVKLLTGTADRDAPAIPPRFEKFELQYGEVEFSVIPTTTSASKICFHFMKIPKNFMIKISNFFFTQVRHKIVTAMEILEGASMECGENPIFRSKYDVTISNLNPYHAHQKAALIIKALKKEFPR